MAGCQYGQDEPDVVDVLDEARHRTGESETPLDLDENGRVVTEVHVGEDGHQGQSGSERPDRPEPSQVGRAPMTDTALGVSMVIFIVVVLGVSRLQDNKIITLLVAKS
jgi:hypothetical protein